ncbi:MAG: hypothetical protein HC893_02175 [Chloroflexaceae bacterium]|nr:hypothetical protein [Chloroflexaceae bacterium]NJO06988.1 hypothetical protein [Chloroflexaceae bacterium]
MMRDVFLEPASFDLAAKIVRDGLAYAERLGFSPDPEYHQARLLLAGANPDACTIPVPVGGKAGKPVYMPGPHDNVEHIVSILTQAVGPNGFELRQP